jgi:hypothetical protein
MSAAEVETIFVRWFAIVMGECDLEATGAPSIFKLIRSSAALARMLLTFSFVFITTDKARAKGGGRQKVSVL